MKRRICLAGIALSAIPLAFGVSAAIAAKHKTHKPKPKPVPVSCKTNVAVMIASGDTDVTPPVSQGDEYGTVSCGKVFRRGVQHDKFNVPDSGDTTATYTWYFPLGTVSGTYTLTPQEGSLNFLSVDYLGTMTVNAGTGLFQGVKGTGTMVCSTSDGIHTSCTDSLKLIKPTAVAPAKH